MQGRNQLSQDATYIRSHYPDLQVRTELSRLSPTHALEADSRESSLIVTGTRDHGGFAGMRVGSVTWALAAHTLCPLAVVPGAADPDAADEVVVGVGPRHSGAALRYAFGAARSRGASLTAVRAWWPVTAATGMAATVYVEDSEIVQQDATSDAEEALTALRAEYPDVNAKIVVCEGNTVDVLLSLARRSRLLVVGSRRPRGQFAVGAGYAVDGVIAHSAVPVAVVPTVR